MSIIITLLLSLSAPLLLIPVEKFLPYPYILEEFVKLFLVLIILQKEKFTKQNLIKYIILSGLLFTISESVFYLSNIFALANFKMFPLRLLLTGCLHVGTILIIYGFAKSSKKYLIIGIPIAILIHYLYNLWVASLVW